jgi:flagellar hook-associated protein 3 FlgL
MSTSRVSTAQMFGNAQANVAKARDREQVSTEKAATQKEINRPSQDPSGWMLANSLKDDKSVRETVSKNAQVAGHVLKATETVFEQAQEYLGRAYELVLSVSGTPMGGPSARLDALAEVKGIYDNLLQALNFKYGSRTLLAGHNSQGPAFDSQGNFVGDSGVLEIDIDRELRVPLTMSAERHILGQGTQDGVDILGAFNRLMVGLETDDSAMIHGTIEDMKKGIEQLSIARAEVGSRQLSIDHALGRHSTHLISTAEQVSKIEDADAIKVFSELARDQTILQAAIRTSEKILSENPVEMLLR